jgi:hypothetical protein
MSNRGRKRIGSHISCVHVHIESEEEDDAHLVRACMRTGSCTGNDHGSGVGSANRVRRSETLHRRRLAGTSQIWYIQHHRGTLAWARQGAETDLSFEVSRHVLFPAT